MKFRNVPINDLVDKIKKWNPRESIDNRIIQYIDIGSVSRDTKDIGNIIEVETCNAPSRARQIVNSGDVIVSTVRPNLNAISYIDKEYNTFTASTGFTVLRPNIEKLFGRYLYYWVQTTSFIKEMISKATGQSYPAVSDSMVKNSKIPLPPLAEQKRIAGILDQADAIRRKRQQAIDKLNSLIPAIFNDMFGDPVINSKKLPVVKLDDICKRITDGTHLSPKWENSGIPFIFISNVKNSHITFETKKHISIKTWRELTDRCPIEKNDILYTTVGSYGNVAIVDTDEKFAFQRHIAHIKPDFQKVVPQFLESMLQSDGILRQAHQQARGIAQKTLNLRELKEFIVFDIDMGIQHDFAKKIVAIKKLKAKQEQSAVKEDALFNSLVQRAFKGEL